MDTWSLLTWIVILLSLVGIAAGSLPRLRMNRATMAFAAAAALVVPGARGQLEAFIWIFTRGAACAMASI